MSEAGLIAFQMEEVLSSVEYILYGLAALIVLSLLLRARISRERDGESR